MSDAAQDLYEDFYGVSASTPSTIFPAAGFGNALTVDVEASSGATLASVDLTGPAAFNGALPAAASAYQLVVPAPLPVGIYTLTATDSNGLQTIASVQVATMTGVSPEVDCSQPSYSVALNSSLGFQSIGYSPLATNGGPPLWVTQGLKGKSATVNIPIAGNPFPVPIMLVAEDIDGNSIGMLLLCGNQLPPAGPGIRTNVLPGSASTIPLGAGINATNINVTNSNGVGAIELVLMSPPHLSPGTQNAGNGFMYGLMLRNILNSFDLEVPDSVPIFSPSSSTTSFVTVDARGNLSALQALAQAPTASNPTALIPIAPTSTNQTTFNSYILEAPTSTNTVVASTGAAILNI